MPQGSPGILHQALKQVNQAEPEKSHGSPGIGFRGFVLM